MKVYSRGSNDLEVQIERLQLRVRDLEDINEGHRQLNGELRKEIQELKEKASELGVEKVDLEYLLKNSDIISLHTPLTEDTKNIISSEAISIMKKGSESLTVLEEV